MTAKNPYELRYDLLQFARQNLMDKYFADLDLFKEGKSSERPEFPKTETLFSLAEQYKSFIERK